MPLFEPTIEPEVNDFRLTGVSGTAVMTADNSALSTIYLTPYVGNRIALYNGATWDTFYSGQVSLAVTGRTTDLPFDIFAFNLNGVLTLETLNWTNATTRATPLVLLDGVWTRSGSSTRRYVGTCRPRSATTYSWVTAGVNSPARLDLWNAANRVISPCSVISNVDSWTYTTQTWRQAQNSANYQIEIVAGLQECVFGARLLMSSGNSDLTLPRERSVGIGFDSTTAFVGIVGGCAAGNSDVFEHTAQVSQLVPIGRHFFAWLEISVNAGTTTWYGDNGAARAMSGMSGAWPC